MAQGPLDVGRSEVRKKTRHFGTAGEELMAADVAIPPEIPDQ